MWILILLLNIVVFVAGYLWFNEKLKKNSGLESIVRRYRKEIDGVTLAFNTTSVDNITLLESRVEEVRNLTALLDERIAAYKKIYAELEHRSKSAAREKLDRLTESVLTSGSGKEGEGVLPRAAEKTKKTNGRGRKDKRGLIFSLFEEDLSVKEIASRLDLSEEEVRFHLQKEHRI